LPRKRSRRPCRKRLSPPATDGGTIDLIVTNGDFPIDRSLAKELEPIQGVKEVHAKIFDQAKIVIGDKKIPIMVMGFDLKNDAKKKPMASRSSSSSAPAWRQWRSLTARSSNST